MRIKTIHVWFDIVIERWIVSVNESPAGFSFSIMEEAIKEVNRTLLRDGEPKQTISIFINIDPWKEKDGS